MSNTKSVNNAYGIRSIGLNATVRIEHSKIIGNNTGLSTVSGGALLSGSRNNVQSERGQWKFHRNLPNSISNCRSMMVKNTKSANNAYGIGSIGPNVTVRVEGSTITGNGAGIAALSGGSLLTLHTNVVARMVTTAHSLDHWPFSDQARNSQRTR